MDRPRTGRRRVRSGAVRATEIIDRATRRFPRPSASDTVTAPDADPDDAPTAELAAVTGGHAAEPVSKTAKLAGLVLAALTLCGTVGAAVIVSRERGTSAHAGPAAPITGQRALLPDALAAAVSGSAVATPTPAPPVTTASTAIVGASRESGGGDEAGDGTRPAAEYLSPPPSTDGMSDEDLVTEYYRLVRSAPVHAFGLLSGTEFGADLGHFISSWSGVTDVRVGEIRATADGVLADVRLLLESGQTLWVRQLFHVTDTTPRRIAHVVLLSAQVS